MRIAKKHIDIFVGAGITKDSNPYSEWQETAAKAETMKNILN
jgi:isochorismate synthase